MPVTNKVSSVSASMEDRLGALHQRALVNIPSLSRVSSALYYKQSDLLRTYVHSTKNGNALVNYEYLLGNSISLSDIARTGKPRLLKDLRAELIGCSSEHTDWLLEQKYKSSFTVPMYNRGEFIGFIFYDADSTDAFTTMVQKDLLLQSILISMTVAFELDVVQTIMASTEVANEFMHLRDFETGAHLERMAQYSRLIARELYDHFDLDDEFIERLYQAAPLHDIGKIGIADSVLLKTGELDSTEREDMRAHIKKGIHVAKRVMESFGVSDTVESQMILNVIGQHHEFLDGSGYPNGLKGDDISIEGRIITVADIFDALISERPYKEAWSVEASFAELNRMAQAGKIDKHCVRALVSNADRVVEIIAKYQDK